MRIKNKLIFEIFILSILFSCNSSDEMPSNPSLGSCYVTFYNRIDALIGYTYMYNVSGQLIETNQLYKSKPETGYKYLIEPNQVTISSAYLGSGSSSPVYENIFTVVINTTGFPTEVKLPNGFVLKRYYYKNNLLNYTVQKSDFTSNDSIVYTYDSNGKNIASSKQHYWDSTNKSWTLGTTYTFESDTKVNPFYKVIGQEGSKTDDPYFFSQNNFTKERDYLYSYIYNDKNYPLSRSASGKGANNANFTYDCK